MSSFWWVRSRFDIPVRLHPAEAEVVSSASGERRREFATGRECARRALRALGVDASAPLLPNAEGAPQWPVGVVGSITHCLGYRAAAVARSTDLFALGIDAEPDQPLAPELAPIAETPAGLPSRLAFCAKEAVFKAHHPLSGGWLDFADIATDLRPDGTFTAWIADVIEYDGRWAVDRDVVLATAWREVRSG